MALFASYIAVKPPRQRTRHSGWSAASRQCNCLPALLIVAGLSTINPATAGLDEAVKRPDVVRGMLRVTRHPFLWGVFLWSAIPPSALPATPPASLLFGSIGLVALRGTWSIDRKRRLALGPAWRDLPIAPRMFLSLQSSGRQQLPSAKSASSAYLPRWPHGPRLMGASLSWRRYQFVEPSRSGLATPRTIAASPIGTHGKTGEIHRGPHPRCGGKHRGAPRPECRDDRRHRKPSERAKRLHLSPLSDAR